MKLQSTGHILYLHSSHTYLRFTRQWYHSVLSSLCIFLDEIQCRFVLPILYFSSKFPSPTISHRASFPFMLVYACLLHFPIGRSHVCALVLLVTKTTSVDGKWNSCYSSHDTTFICFLLHLSHTNIRTYIYAGVPFYLQAIAEWIHRRRMLPGT